MEMLGPERKPAVKGRSSYKRPLVKVAAWIVAVPALCTVVVLGGAAPVYLLLPDAATPPVTTPQETANLEAGKPSAVPAPVRGDDVVEPALAEASPPSGSGATGSAEVADEAPPVEPVETEKPEAVATVMPTPRPKLTATELAAIGAAARAKPEPAARMPAERQEAGLSRPERRSFTIRPTAVRSAPGGREIGMLGRGAEVLVGRCDDWCEVSADGLKGWLHPSFLREASERPAAVARSENRGPVDRRDRSWEEDADRRDARPVRRYHDDGAGEERFVGRERWRTEDRDPVEFYGYE